MVHRKISIHEKVFKILEELRNEKGFGSISDTVAYLVNYYQDTRELIKEIKEIICSTAKLSVATISSTANISHTTHTTVSSIRGTVSSKRKPWGVKRGARNPESYARKMEKMGYIVAFDDTDVFYVTREFLEELVEKANKVGVKSTFDFELLGKEEAEALSLAHRFGMVEISEEGVKLK